MDYKLKIKELWEKMTPNNVKRLNAIEDYHHLEVHLYAKVESENLTGSIKDKPALQMVEKAIAQRKLKKGATIIEPTSGNMGISLAYIGRELGFKVVIVMPSSMSQERKDRIKEYGATLVEVEGGMSEAVKKAKELVKSERNYVMMEQFYNPSNSLAHYLHTAPEIEKNISTIDIVICGIGTGGTISGIGKYFKKKNPNIKIIGVEPAESPLLTKGEAGPHLIQGIGANFVPKILEKEFIDEVIDVKGQDAIQEAKLVNKLEGLFVGYSSGAALKAGIEVAKKNKKKNIVVIFPDSGDRYQWN